MGFQFQAQYLACTHPCQRFTCALRTPMHDSEPVWIANPSPYETFIHNTLPVFTGAPKSKTNPKIPKLKSENRKSCELLHEVNLNGRRVTLEDGRP
jgi:hypothetical protein